MASRSAGEGHTLTLWTDRDLDCNVELSVDPRTPVHALKRLLAGETEADPQEFGIMTPCGRVLADDDVVPEGLLELEVCDPQLRSGSTSDRNRSSTRATPTAEKRHAQSPTWSSSTTDWQSDLGDSPRGPDCDSSTEYSFMEDGPDDDHKTIRTLDFDECDEDEDESLSVHRMRSLKQRLTVDFADLQEVSALTDSGDDSDEAATPRASPRGPGTLQLATPLGTFGGLVPPAPGCTLGAWKGQLGSGEALGDRVLYPGKLQYYRGVGGTAELRPLGDADPLPALPDALAVFGPASLLKMLEMALVKRVGYPDASRPARLPAAEELSALPSRGAGRGEALEFCFLSLQGHRPAQEDRACAAADLPGCAGWASLFGVFDGHGGPQAADFVARRLPEVIGERLLGDRGDPARALTEAFAAVDEELRAAGGARGLYDLIGTTATVVLLVGAPCERRRLYCASAGDSRAVLCRGGEALDLSRDHKPELPEEGERIRAAGGLVGTRGRISLRRGSEGGLNLSRSLGDFSYKARRHLAADGQMVIPHPGVVDLPIQEDDEFFAIGSDGLFDSCDGDELVASVRGALSRGVPMDLAVRAPVREALPGGDNTTLCLVRFGSAR